MSVTIVIENPDGVPSIGLDNREKIANNLMGIETHALNNQLLEKIFLLEKESKFIIYVCIFETINNGILFIFAPTSILLLALSASYAGYMGAKEFKIWLVGLHLLLEIIMSVVKTYSVVIYYNKLQEIQYLLNFLGTFFQFFITFITFRFLKILIQVKNNVLE